MTETVRERVYAAFAALQSAVDVESERNRGKAVELNNYPRIVIIDGDDDVDEDNNGIKRHTGHVTIEGYAKAEKTEDLGSEYNTLMGDVIKAALSDHTLGGLAVDVREESTAVQIDRDSSIPSAVFEIKFVIDYFTSSTDPYELAP